MCSKAGSVVGLSSALCCPFALPHLTALLPADHILHAFDTLRSDITSDEGKQLFHTYRGTAVLLRYFQSPTHAFVSCAADAYLTLTIDSPHAEAFLADCATEEWVRAAVVVLDSPGGAKDSDAAGHDVTTKEKVAVVLQKLSKLR